MTLSSMVVSRDWQEVSVLECILGGLQMDVAVESEPSQVLSKLSKSKVDALIVDCDLAGTSQLLRELHSAGKPSATIPILMGGARVIDNLGENSVPFTFTKPVSVEQAVRTLSAARTMILDGRLRYHRSSLEVPVALKSKSEGASTASLVNLSQNGMQVIAETQPRKAAPMQVSFELPGLQSKWNAQAEVVWQDDSGHMGLRFVKVAPRQQRALQLWLAQQFLTN